MQHKHKHKFHTVQNSSRDECYAHFPLRKLLHTYMSHLTLPTLAMSTFPSVLFDLASPLSVRRRTVTHCPAPQVTSSLIFDESDSTCSQEPLTPSCSCRMIQHEPIHTSPLQTESVLFIGTQFSILYTSMYSPAEAATPRA